MTQQRLGSNQCERFSAVCTESFSARGQRTFAISLSRVGFESMWCAKAYNLYRYIVVKIQCWSHKGNYAELDISSNYIQLIKQVLRIVKCWFEYE